MSDPITLGLAGAAGGALLDKGNPLRGAALGGMGGYFAGPALLGAEAMPAGVTGMSGASGMGVLGQVGSPAQVSGIHALSPAFAGFEVSPTIPASSSFGLGELGGSAQAIAPQFAHLTPSAGGGLMGKLGAAQTAMGLLQPKPQQPMPTAPPRPMQASGGSFAQMSPYSNNPYDPRRYGGY